MAKEKNGEYFIIKFIIYIRLNQIIFEKVKNV